MTTSAGCWPWPGEQSIDEYQPDFDQYNYRIEEPWLHLVEAEEILENECMRALVVEKITILPDAYRIVLPSPDNQIPDYVPEDLIKAILEARNR